MTFLEIVNRILRLNAILRGDTDPISSFSDTQHNASLNLAVVCVQDELINLVSDRLIPSERDTSGTITLVASQRTYSLASGFLRFYGAPHLRKGTTLIGEWPGGLESLQIEIPNYDTETGEPNWFYFEPTTTKKIGFFQVPANSGDVWEYEFQTSTVVSASSDTLPFHNTEENIAFALMASRRFKFSWEDVKNELDIAAVLDKDRTYVSAKATLMNLIRGTRSTRSYANYYQ